MKKRKTFLVILFLLAVTALAVVSELRLRREAAPETAGERLEIPAFLPEDVRTVEISWRNQKSTLDFMPEGKYWSVKERSGAQAASALVAELLNGLAKTAPLKELEITGEADYLDLNLVDPAEIARAAAAGAKPQDLDPAKGEGILTVLRDQNGAELLRIMFGRGHTKLAADRIGNLAVQGYDGRYVRVWYPDNTSRVFLISRVFEKCAPAPRQWLEPLYLSKPESPVYARFQRKKPGTETADVLWFVNSSEKGFSLLFPPADELDMEAFSRIYSALASPFSVDLVANVPANAAFNDVFQTVMSDGFAYTLEFARVPDAEAVLGRLNVSFNEKNVRRLTGEPDDAFEHRLKQLASRAEYEMRTANGKTFLLKSGLLELLSAPPGKSANKEK